MAKAVLTITKDKVTGKREISISYISDPDALPIEHEEGHSDLLDKVFDGGLKANGLKAERDASKTNSQTRQEQNELAERSKVSQNG